MCACGLPEEFWVHKRAQCSQAEKSWQAMQRHQVGAPSHLVLRGSYWTPKASSLAHCLHCITWTWASPEFEKQKMRKMLVSRKRANYICETQKNMEKHRISRIFDSISTTLRRGELPGLLPSVGGNHPRGNLPSVGGKSPLLRAVQILRNFAKYSKYLSFSRRFARFSQSFLGVLFAKHIDFGSFSHVFSVFYMLE